MSSIYVSSLNETQDKMSLLLSIEQARMTRVMEVLLSFALGAISHLRRRDWARHVTVSMDFASSIEGSSPPCRRFGQRLVVDRRLSCGWWR